MALAWNTGLTDISTAENTTGWSGFNDSTGGSPTPQQEADFVKQASFAVSVKISGTGLNRGVWFDVGSGNEIDFTVTGRHFYGWVNFTTVNNLFTRANGGLYIKAASDASGNNWSKWYIDGNDTYTGDFKMAVLDLNKTPSITAATAATISSIRWIGFGVNQTGSAKAENLIVDAMRYGQAALQPYSDAVGNQTVDWQSFFDEDDSTNNKYGIVDKRGTIFYLRGGITFGDAAQSGTTTFDDATNAVVEFEAPTYYNGSAVVSAIDAANLYIISAEGASTQNTDVIFGDKVGTGADRQGLNGGVLRSAGPKFGIDFETDSLDINDMQMFGMTVKGAGNCKFQFTNNNAEVVSTSFVNCDEVQINSVDFVNNTIIAPVPDRGLEFPTGSTPSGVNFVAGSTADQVFDRVWQVDVSTTPDTFVDETDDANSAATGDWAFFPATEGVGDYVAFGSIQKFQKLRIDTGTARSGGSVSFDYWSGSAWTALTVTDGTNGFSTTGLQDITFTPPTDWAATSLNDEDPLFYVRATVDSTFTTNPIGDQGFIADTVEHHLHFPEATRANGYSATDLVFFGFGAAGAPKWHGENSETKVTTTAGSFTTNQYYKIETVGSTDFTLIGSPDNVVGTIFKATGPGTGTGTASEVLQINNTGTSNGATNEFDDTGATPGATQVSSSAPVSIEVVDANLDPIANVRAAVYLTSDNSEVLNADTNGSGIASTTFTEATPAAIYWRVRESPTGSDRYFPENGIGTITASGFSTTVKLDPLPPSYTS